MSSCPSPETIGQFVNAGLSGPRSTAMEAHVENCPACQDILERLADESSECEIHRAERLPPPERPPTIPGFVIEREIGRGGMGVVYQAWQPQLDRRVAVKVVSVIAGIGAEDRRGWLREARAIGRVRHRNVVRLHEVGQQDGCLYLVLDLITGGSLAERITGPLPERVAVALMSAVAQAVEQVHKAGMLHLDIKPSNILLDGPADGPWDRITPMLADFGIARAGDDPHATVTGLIGVRGTPSFMAPEQVACDRAEIGPRSDVYALGATLYTLLTGRPPFQASSVIETLDLVRTREPAPPGTLVPGLARDLETIALTCLHKDPRRRYPSAEALATDLDRWLEGFPIRARPVSKLEHAGRWCRRRPAIASLLAVLALTVASSLAGLLTLWRYSESERSRAENALARAIESDKATSGAIHDLVGLLTSNVEAPQMLASERLVESSRAVRDLTKKLRHDRTVSASSLLAICGLERELAEGFLRRGKYAESVTLFMDNKELLEARRGSGNDPDAQQAYARSLWYLGLIAMERQQYDESLAWLRRAEESLLGLALELQNVPAILSIDQMRGTIAELFSRRGQDESRRRLLESHVVMLERLSRRDGADPVIGLLAALGRVDLSPDERTRAKIHASLGGFPADRQLPMLLVVRLGVWIAREIDPYPPDPESAGGPPGRLEPDAHARAIILSLDSKCETLGVYSPVLHSAANQVCVIGCSRAYKQRNDGRLDHARWTVASLIALGKMLAKRDPNDAVFHLMLSEAFEQEAKNAWKVNDFSAIEAATRNALVEASTAIRLDPRSMHARMKVTGLQDKIVGLASNRP